MTIDLTQPDLTIIRERPMFVPAFCLMFVVIGLANLVIGALSGDWDTNRVFGIAVCLLLGGGLFLYTARRCEYRFHRGRRELRWIQRNLLLTRAGRIRFEDIERVALHRGPENDSTLHRVVLYTPDGQFPLSNGYTANKPELEAVVEAIESALREVVTNP